MLRLAAGEPWAARLLPCGCPVWWAQCTSHGSICECHQAPAEGQRDGQGVQQGREYHLACLVGQGRPNSEARWPVELSQIPRVLRGTAEKGTQHLHGVQSGGDGEAPSPGCGTRPSCYHYFQVMTLRKGPRATTWVLIHCTQISFARGWQFRLEFL